jgi:Putative zinc-finger
MTLSGYSGPACREVRQLLGVYVVGAIDAADRALVDEHLGQCQACRDELAGLAALPAMLSRVPAADLERLGLAATGLPDMAEPPTELLNSLLRRVSARRRSRMWRSIAAVAAAAILAAGGATAAVQLARPGAVQVAQRDVASGASASTHVAAVVDYSPTPWGSTAMRVQVTGINPGTTCEFWVIGKAGRSYAGSWTVSEYSYGQGMWYPASSTVASSSVRSFQITAGGRVLVNIPAS